MSGLLANAEEDMCASALLCLLSRGHAVVAELQRVADALPPAFTGTGAEAKRFAPVLPDFSVFRTEGAVENLASTPELIELDEESRELHAGACQRLFRTLAAIRKYAMDLGRFLSDLEAGIYINQSLDSVIRDPDGTQLVPEAIALLGAMLLLLDERIPSASRERGLVAFYRFTVGTNDASDDFSDICHLFKANGRPADGDFAKRSAGYPEQFFARFPLPKEGVRMAIGQMQTGDIYCQGQHYPLPEHRSHSLAAQAGLLYLVLFFDVQTLEQDVVAMREIVNRHFGDAWVVAYALGFTADLLAMWAPYPAAREALDAAVTPATVQHLRNRHIQKLQATRQQLTEYLTDGALTEDVVLEKSQALMNCLRQANTTIRWLLLQPTTVDARMQAVFTSSSPSREELLEALVDTALLEDRVRGLLGPLVARREADWTEQKNTASQNMDDLAVYFSGQHALKRNVKNEELEQWFRENQQRIDDLQYGTRKEDNLALGRKVSQLLRALEEVEHFHEISNQPQILHFLSDTRSLLQRMVRTVNLKDELMDSVASISDLSYAWKALGAYEESMCRLLGNSSGSVKGLRALFLKLASILEVPLKRIRQIFSFPEHETLVAEYYSARLVDFMRSVLQEIPRLIFNLLDKISQERDAQLPDPLPSRISLEDLQAYAQRSDDAREQVGNLTKNIASLMRGIREADVAVLGVNKLEPRVVLVEGLRDELARQIEGLLSRVMFPTSGQKLVRNDVEAPLKKLASKSKLLRSSFEHVQDYLGVSALEMWHVQFGRIVRFLSHMEQHWFLRKRVPPAAISPHHVADCPVTFPDQSYAKYISSGVGGTIGGSFISRVCTALLLLTDPKTTVGGLQGEWRSADEDELLLDGLLFETMHQSLGPPGMAAVSKFLGLRTAMLLRKCISHSSEINAKTQALLSDAAEKARAGGSDAARKLRAAAQHTSALHAPLLDALTNIGQHQLLRSRIHRTLSMHATLSASLAAESMRTMDAAELAENIGSAQEIGDPELPSVLDLEGSGRPSAEELLARFHRRLARAAELPGFGDPMRMIYVSVEEGSIAQGFDVLLALALLSPSAIASKAAAVRKTRKGESAQPGLVQVRRYSDTNSALLAGIATLLQQLPRAYKDGVIQLCGAHVVSVCAAGAEGKERDVKEVAESARLAELLGDLLDLLGLPREQLAEFIPQGLLDLLPVEGG